MGGQKWEREEVEVEWELVTAVGWGRGGTGWSRRSGRRWGQGRGRWTVVWAAGASHYSVCKGMEMQTKWLGLKTPFIFKERGDPTLVPRGI